MDSSSVPVGSCASHARRLKAVGRAIDVDVIIRPENQAEAEPIVEAVLVPFLRDGYFRPSAVQSVWKLMQRGSLALYRGL